MFNACQTQWRVGFGGAYGLIYGEARIAARELGIDWLDVKPLVQALEYERLAFDSEKDEEANKDSKKKTR